MVRLELIGGAGSTYVWVCRMTCAEKGVPYRLTEVWPQSPEANAIHPLGKIPAMRDGEVTLFESKAICTYINKNFKGPQLIPPGHGALEVEQWISLVNTAIDPVCVRQYCAAYFFPETPDHSPDYNRIREALPKMQHQLGVLDRAVAKTGFLVGTKFSLADINVMPILFYLSQLPESAAMIASLPHLAAYYARHAERPSFKSTIPHAHAA